MIKIIIINKLFTEQSRGFTIPVNAYQLIMKVKVTKCSHSVAIIKDAQVVTYIDAFGMTCIWRQIYRALVLG